MSKSRFDGGTLGNGRWDEEEHPRGKDGRFASGGSSDPTAKKDDDDPKTAKMREKLKAMMERNARLRAENAARKAALEEKKGRDELEGAEFHYGEEVHWQNGPFKFSGNVVGRVASTGRYRVKTDRGDVAVINGNIYRKGEKPKSMSTPFGRVYL